MLALVACSGCALFGGEPADAPSLAESYRAARQACNVYELLPAEQHTPEGDEACADLARVCKP